jgi:hypothetical protein
MSDWLQLGHNELMGYTTWWRKDPVTGENVIKYTQDVAPILEDNIKFQNSGSDGYNKARDLVHAAHIPAMVIIEWKQKYGFDMLKPNYDRNVLKRLLNSSEYQYLRRNTGRL